MSENWEVDYNHVILLSHFNEIVIALLFACNLTE